MTIHSFQAEVISRGARMLRTALGPAIATWLEDPSVVEVMLNPDGRLWIDRLSTGLVETQERLAAAEGERIVRLVAHHVGAEVHSASPKVSAELPETGERFEGPLPPVVPAPTFAIRKPTVAVFHIDIRLGKSNRVGHRITRDRTGQNNNRGGGRSRGRRCCNPTTSR